MTSVFIKFFTIFIVILFYRSFSLSELLNVDEPSLTERGDATDWFGEKMGSVSYFSTKTAYRYLVPLIKSQNLTLLQDFRPTKLWGLIRHGTRYPGKKMIHRYNNLTNLRDEFLNNGNDFLTSKQIHDFLKWKPFPLDPNREKFLDKEGSVEMLELGKRMKLRFPTLFNDQNSLMIYHTPTERTERSAQGFSKGLSLDISPDTFKRVARDDAILRPYKQCSRWRKEVKKNKEAFREIEVFKQSPIVENLVNEFREKMKLDYLTVTDLQVFYTMCGYEDAWFGHSPWCHLFNEKSLKIMEFLEDLEYFWIDGYGYEVTRNVACKTVENIFDCLSPNSNEPEVNLLFTHSGTLLKLLTFLELYKDDFQLTSDNFGRKRLWKTSQIDAFASNIFFILLESKTHGNFVLTLHNENSIKLPRCNYDNKFGLCRYEEFEEAYVDRIRNCNLSKLCSVKDEL